MFITVFQPLGTDGLIKNENFEIGNELNNFFANVGKNIQYDFDKNGFVKTPWSWLNKKCFIQDSIQDNLTRQSIKWYFQ